MQTQKQTKTLQVMRVCATHLLLLLPVYEQVVYSIFTSEENTPFSTQVAHKHIDKYSNLFSTISA